MSAEAKVSYKQNSRGLIPADWTVSHLRNLCGKITTGKLDANAMIEDGEYPFFTCARESYQIDRYAFDTEALLISGNGANVGYIHYYNGKFNAYQRTYVISDFRQEVHYLKHYMSKNLQERLRTEVNAGNTPYIVMGTLADLEVAHPVSTAEQRAIAAALSDMDALVSSLDQLIAKKRDIKQAAMQQLLTGQARLPGFSEEWGVRQLGDLAVFLKGKGLPKSALDPYGEDACIHYGELFTQYPETIGDIFSRTNDCGDALYSSANDVLMPTSDVTPRGLAKASCIKIDGVILGGDILVIRADAKKLDGSFLSRIIRYEADQVLQLVTGSTVFHLYGSDMKKFTFALPPVAEQKAIVKILSDMESEISALEVRRGKANQIKQGMMQELLTGRIRLL